jgi:uncharacterized protein YerC
MALLKEVRRSLRRLKRKPVYTALLSCKTEAEIKALISDLLSTKEIKNIEARWAIAQSFLATGCSKNEAERYHKASQDQVGRVYVELHPKRPRRLGYRLVYRRLFGEAVRPT